MFESWKEREFEKKMERFRTALQEKNTILIGAGAGLSTSAGFTYSGERFRKYFADFEQKYGFHDMYSGGFYPFDTLEEHWAWWSRHIWINRYMDAPKPVYNRLYELVKNRDYFVLTTNVDHQFQKAGFDKHRLFYTQGDYGLWQCSVPCHNETYDNEAAVRKMVAAQGFAFAENGDLYVPDGIKLKMEVPSELIPYCPHCHKPMSMNLRADDTLSEYIRLSRLGEAFFNPNVNLIPFSDGFSLSFLLNIFLFIPLGFLSPFISKTFERVRNIFFIGLGLSLFIETTQLFTLYRATDVNDILTNVAGTMIGYFCFRLIAKLRIAKLYSSQKTTRHDYTAYLPIAIIIIVFILGFFS